ncbi:unnamed protein product [Lymnaea stagnalis]|uniref:SH3 domain-containing protein n=1 Tax=Lymnaea stagnalis TaxID=6523 RepID=A0AAV2I0F7_LYMST
MSDLFIQEDDEYSRKERHCFSKTVRQPVSVTAAVDTCSVNRAQTLHTYTLAVDSTNDAYQKTCAQVIGEQEEDDSVYSQLAVVNENYTNSIKSEDIDWEEVRKYEEHVRKIDEPIRICDNSAVYTLPNIELIRQAPVLSDDLGDDIVSALDLKSEDLGDDIVSALDLKSEDLSEVITAINQDKIEGNTVVVSEPGEVSSLVPADSSVPASSLSKDAVTPVSLEESPISSGTVDERSDVESGKTDVEDVGLTLPLEKSNPQPIPQPVKKSPRSGFSLLSFFDRILLPNDKKNAAEKTASEVGDVKTDDSVVTTPTKIDSVVAQPVQDLVPVIASKISPAGTQPSVPATPSKPNQLSLDLTPKKTNESTPSRIRSIFFKTKAPNPDKEKIIQEEKELSCKIITTAGAVRNKSAENFPKARPLSAFVDRDTEFMEDSAILDSKPHARPLSMYDLPYGESFPIRNTDFILTSNGSLPVQFDGQAVHDLACTGFKTSSTPAVKLSADDDTCSPITTSPAAADECSEASSSESDISERPKLISEIDVAQICQWDGKTDNNFTVPEYRYVLALTTCPEEIDSDKLAFIEGDYLQVLAQLDSQYIYCSSGKKEGLVDLADVEPLPEGDFQEPLSESIDQ